jgi:hypothetical protein
MDSKNHTAEAQFGASACKVAGWLALLCFIVLMLKPSQLISGIFLMLFGIYAILQSVGTYKSKNVHLVTGRQLHGKRAQITSVLDTGIGIVLLSLGLITLIWDFLLPN